MTLNAQRQCRPVGGGRDGWGMGGDADVVQMLNAEYARSGGMHRWQFMPQPAEWNALSVCQVA